MIDIHQIRKEINATNDTLQRSFHATDELIWKVRVRDRESERCADVLLQEIAFVTLDEG